MTDNEKRGLRILLARQKEVRERKAAARRGGDPKHKADWPAGFTPAEIGERAAKTEGKTRMALMPEEIAFLKKLCRLESFTPTFPERVMLEVFKEEGLVKIRADGSVEVTRRGADRYIGAKYGLPA